MFGQNYHRCNASMPTITSVPLSVGRGRGKARTSLTEDEQRYRRERLQARSGSPTSTSDVIGAATGVTFIVLFLGGLLLGGGLYRAEGVVAVVLIAIGAIIALVAHRQRERARRLTRFAVPRRAEPGIRPVPGPEHVFSAGNLRVQRRTHGDHRTLAGSRLAQSAGSAFVACLVALVAVAVICMVIVLMSVDLVLGISLVGIAGLPGGIWLYGSRTRRSHGAQARRASHRVDSWLAVLVSVPLLVLAPVAAGINLWIVLGVVVVVAIEVFLYLCIRNSSAQAN